MQLPYIPADVPFSGDQKAWLAGFLAGLNTRITMMPASPALATTAAASNTGPDAGPIAVQIVYGTQTGTAEFLATEAANAARAKGFLPLVCGLDELEIAALSAVRRLLVITSTYGEGDMPDNAELFWRALAAPTAPPLAGLFFGVLALGDSSYDGFCQAGKNIDTRLAELGATRVVDRVDCDVDYDDPAAAWTSAAIDALARIDADAVPRATDATTTSARPLPSSSATSPYGRKNPYRATILANTVLSGPGSAKEVRHVVLSLGDSGITYRPGDGISIRPTNDPALASAIVDRLGVPGDTVITDRSGTTTLLDALIHRWEISTPSKYLVDYIAQRSQDPELTHLTSTGDREALDAWLWGRDVLDLLNIDATLPITPDELLAELRPLQPRVYSISSSPLAHADTVHITMATVRYRSGDRIRGGVCSTFLTDRLDVGSGVDVYISTNNAFRLPADDHTAVIMIGPGTGIAPFRSFLHERAARGAAGRNWLFFGDQRRATDFSYADELEQLRTDGVLTRLDLAFSRDQDHKVYVQDRMHDVGAELFEWLDGGAHLYVCGDATRMARDVDAALHEIVATHGGLDPAAAQDYVNSLKKSKRYLRDVY